VSYISKPKAFRLLAGGKRAQTWWIAVSTVPNSSSVCSDIRRSLNAISRFTSPVDATPHFGHGQMASNSTTPQFRQSAHVILTGCRLESRREKKRGGVHKGEGAPVNGIIRYASPDAPGWNLYLVLGPVLHRHRAVIRENGASCQAVHSQNAAHDDWSRTACCSCTRWKPDLTPTTGSD